MLDIDQRQALMEKLRNKVKKASSNISTKVEASKGDFKVVVASDSIDYFYKTNKVGTMKVASFDDETVDLINADANEAAHEMLETFASTFDVPSFEKEAEQTKEAAHGTQDEGTWQMITQKQFDDQKPDLHPRTDDYYKNITQKQIPEGGKRPGTYEEITEAQMAQEKTTFYNEPLDAGHRVLEDRNLVTEGQFDKGATEYADEGKSERGEMGAKFDGELSKQWHQIGEKQLAELLKHHEWTEPLTITEGKDQLTQQDGELGRITSDGAKKIVSAALHALGNTIIAAGVTPTNLAAIVNKLISHPSKYPVLANTLDRYAKHNVSAIQEKIANAQYFGLVTNASQKWSDELVADVLVRQLAKISEDSRHVVKGLLSLAQDDDFATKIDTAVKANLAGQKVADQDPDLEVFSSVISGDEKPKIEGSADEDGLYQYAGKVEEIKADVSDKDAFVKAAADHAREVIATNVNKDLTLNPLSIDVNEELGTFKIQMKDASFKSETLETRAEKRRKLAKQADIVAAWTCPCGQKVPAGQNCSSCGSSNPKQAMKEAQMGGGGGMPPAGGDQMGNPMAPPGGADMGAPPPGEAFSQEPPMDEGMPEEGVGGEPKPPGAICPVDGSEDVDVDNGEFRCNSCGAEGTIHVRLDVNKWPETIQETGEEEEPGFGLGAQDEQGMDEMGGLGEPAPGGEGDGTTMPNIPIAASVRVTPLLLQKIAEQKIEMGSVCPNCGGHNTDVFKSASTKGKHGICWDCLQEYNYQIKANMKKAHQVFAQFTWTPKTAESCSSCSRLRSAFAKSLDDYGMKLDDFNNLVNVKDKADVILAMDKAGTLNIKEAMHAPLSMMKHAAAFKQKFEKFPSASCMERIARRFGENATAMAGPCQGKPLADCVCTQLENLGIYTDGLAAKVAHVVSNEDPMIHSPSESCVKMFVMDNYNVKEACTICDGLRAAAATDEELMIEAIAQMSPFAKPMPKPMPKPMGAPMPKPMAPKPMAPKPMAAPTDGMGAPAPAKPMMAPPANPMAPMDAPGAAPMPKPMAAPPTPGMEAPMGAPGMDAAPMPKPMEAPMGAPGGMSAVPAPAPAPMAAPGGMGASPMEAPGGMGASPIDANPMDMPVDDAGDGHLDVEMEMGGGLGDEMGGMGDELGGMGDELGGEFGDDGLEGEFGDTGLEGEGDFQTILIEGLQDLLNALQGALGEDMIDTTGDEGFGEEEGLGGEEEGFGGGEDLDVGDITEDTVEEGGEETSDEEIPGILEDEEDFGKHGDGDEEAMSSPMEEKHMEEKHMEEKHMDKPMEGKHMGKPMGAKPMMERKLPLAAEVEESSLQKQASTDQLDRLLYRMKSGTITKSATALDNLIDGLAESNPDLFKTAKTEGDVKKMTRKEAKESKIVTTPAQDTDGIGQYSDGKSMGHEDKFAADDPSVPRGDATIGDEGTEVNLNDGDRPTVPHGSPLMAGEEHYPAEKGNVVDGNQGSMQTSAETDTATKKAQSTEDSPKEKEDNCTEEGKCAESGTEMKTAKYTVKPGDKYYNELSTRLAEGKNQVKLADKKDYHIKQDEKVIYLTAAACSCGAKPMCDCGSCKDHCSCKDASVNKKKMKKESQTVSPKSVEKLEDDPDINPSSGPGAGKTHADETHSLGVDEKKPSEGMEEPSVPEAPEGGQLKREHTYDNALEGPTIPAGGGMNENYDQNEKNTPEKLDQTLGKENDIAAMAETNRDRAMKIAGQMLKAQSISIDELPNKIAELSKASSAILDDYEKMLKEASTKKGLQKAANVGSTETSFQIQSAFGEQESGEEGKPLKDSIQGLFKLENQNRDYEKFAANKDNRLWH